MNTQTTSKKVLQAIALDREIDYLTVQLDGLKAEFRAEAARCLISHGAATDILPRSLAGNSFNFLADDGSAGRVTFPRPGLLREIRFIKDVAHKSGEDKVLVPVGGNIRKLIGADAWPKLFIETYKPAKAFRELVVALIGEGKAEDLLDLVETEPGVGVVKFTVKESAKASVMGR